MPRRTFKLVDVTEILTHWYAGRSPQEIERSLGPDGKIVCSYIAPRPHLPG